MGNDEQSIKEFWRKKEAEYGDSLVYKSIAQLGSRERASYIGILFLMEKKLCFEYTTSQRKTVLDLLMVRFRKEREDEIHSIVIPREDIVSTFLIPTSKGKKFLNSTSATADDVLSYYREGNRDLLSRIVSGTSLCIVTRDDFFIFQTPENKKWLKYLD